MYVGMYIRAVYAHKHMVYAHIPFMRGPKPPVTQHGHTVQADEPDLQYQYKVAHAMVGRARLDLLHRAVAERVQAKVITGNKDMIRMFNFFARYQAGMGHAVIGYKQFLGAARLPLTRVTLKSQFSTRVFG
jgi:hypothetical protein